MCPIHFLNYPSLYHGIVTDLLEQPCDKFDNINKVFLEVVNSLLQTCIVHC